jgi:hypothetical protein
VTLSTDDRLDEDRAGVGLIVRARSRIYSGLKTPQDINGIYTAIGAGVTLGGGGSIAEDTEMSEGAHPNRCRIDMRHGGPGTY